MGRYVSKCKESGEAAVMEKPVDNTASSAAAGGRKRKTALGESELSKSSIQLKTRRLSLTLSTPDNSASPARSWNSTCESVNSGRVLASRCSSSRPISELAKEISGFVDLEVQQQNEASVEFFPISAAENSVDIIRDRRETTPTPSSDDDVQSESGELESTAGPRETNSGRRSTAAKMPTEAELEDFFTAAENNLQKQFIDKYNYDIVKDEPMEGRYEWVQIQLKP
ncbi:hypothetical protein ABFS83_08G048600 [Erythranthe nasuta]